MMLRNAHSLAPAQRSGATSPLAAAPRRAAFRRAAFRAVAAFTSTGAPRSAALRAAAVAPALPKSISRRPAARVTANWGAPVEFSPAKVTASKAAAAGLQKVHIDVGSLAAGYTKPGQYFQVKVGDCKPGFFAVASAPGNGTALEFLIKPGAPDSAASLLVALPAGSEVAVSPAQGKGFPVDKIPAADYPTVLCFATGSGISPIKAVLDSGILKGRSDVRLYYGTQNAAATAYAEDVAAWKAAGVKVTQVFSEAKKGYVQDAFAADKVSDPKRAAVLLCGRKEMCNAVKEAAAAVGIEADKVLMNF